MENHELIDTIVALAEEIETQSPIDWGMLTIDEKTSYQLMASNVLDMYLSLESDQRELTMLATIVKLVVENFVLYLQLAGKNS